MRRMQLVALAAGLALAFVPSVARATIIIDNTTLGYYNAGLGDLAADSVLGIQVDTATGFRLFPAANVSGGDPTIPPVATEPNLAGADSGTQTNLGGFLTSPGTLVAPWSAVPQAIPGTWTVNSETAIVYPFVVVGGGYANLFVQIAVDNGAYVWLDGAYQFGAIAPGGPFQWEYSFNTGPISPGTHYLQILREDHGGSTGWSIQADAAPVPEPGTLLLLGGGLSALALRRRRRT
jgi:hypothetical protein